MNYMPSKVWDEITYSFQNFNGFTAEFGIDKQFHIPHYIMDVLKSCWD